MKSLSYNIYTIAFHLDNFNAMESILHAYLLLGILFRSNHKYLKITDSTVKVAIYNGVQVHISYIQTICMGINFPHA